MKEKLLHTPDGVRDIYNSECQKKLKVQGQLHHIMKQYGYHDIQTPTFEFIDIFNREKGSVSSSQMYKFFDRDNNTLVLRPDITPSIARCVAKYYDDEEMPIRLSYLGNTFLNNTSFQGKLKEVTQLGAELVNDDSPMADAEIISMVIDSFLAVGLKDFQIEIGQVDFFRGLIEDSKIDQDTEEEIRSLIENKNFFGLEELVNKFNMSDKTKEVLMQFDGLYGGLDIIEKAKSMTENKRSLNALDRILKLHETLEQYGKSQYISYDLGMLSLYNYYTGIIFKGFTYGTGDALVKGGRYNNLLKQFGKNSPSVGCAFVIDELMLALSRQKIQVSVESDATLILFKEEMQKTAIHLAIQFRGQGLKVELMEYSINKSLEDYISYGKRRDIGGILSFEAVSKVKVVTIATNEINEVALEDFMKGME